MTKFCLSPRPGFFTVLFAAAVVLAACAGAGGKWTKAGVGEEAMAADLEQCVMIGQATGLSAIKSDELYDEIAEGALSFMEQGDAFTRCMKARGYKRSAA